MIRRIGDMHKAAAKAKDVLPYNGAGAEKEGKKIGQETGAKIDNAVSHTHPPPITAEPPSVPSRTDRHDISSYSYRH